MEYKPEAENELIARLISEVEPSVLEKEVPGLPAHLMFMAVRFVDNINDERWMQRLLANAINGIRKTVKVSLHLRSTFFIQCHPFSYNCISCLILISPFLLLFCIFVSFFFHFLSFLHFFYLFYFLYLFCITLLSLLFLFCSEFQVVLSASMY